MIIMGPSMKDHSTKEEKPPTYSEVDQPPLIIPPLDLSQNAGLAIDTTVTQDECVVHLKFLAMLADLRETVASTKDLFGIPDPSPELHDQNLNEALAKVKEKRWAVYTSRAAERYGAWWKTCVPSSRSPVRLRDLKKASYSNITDGDIPLPWSRHTLPPLGKWSPLSLVRHSVLEVTDRQDRCTYGLPCTHAEPQSFSGRLHSPWQNEFVDRWVPVETDSRVYRRSQSGVRTWRDSQGQLL